MKKLMCAALLSVVCICQAHSPEPQTEQAGTDNNSVIQPSYHTVYAYVNEVDEEEWWGYCASFSKHTIYGFEILDEVNAGDRVSAIVCDNGTPLIYYDDYVTQVYYGW